MFKAQDISTYNFQSSDKLLLDTNIWFFIYGLHRPGDKRVEIYSNAFSKILSAKCQIFINLLVISEFINTYARLKWDILTKKSMDFKIFRKSIDFQPVAKEIADSIKRILKNCSLDNIGFELLPINKIIDEFAAGDRDFNDQILAAICQTKELKIVTDDSDFQSHGISILTANRKLLLN